MLTVIVVAAATAILAGFIYVRREQMGLEGVGLAALRTISMTALVLLLVNPGRSRREAGGSPVVLLDASLSMAAPGGQWESALDTAVTLAGADGTLYRFGEGVSEYDSEEPTAGASRVGDALRVAAAHGGPVHVVTDGELDDAGVLDPQLLENATVVTLPRDTVPDVTLLDVDMPSRVSTGDSVTATLTVGVWGDIGTSLATLEVFVGERRIVSRNVEIPGPPGVARRQLILPPRMLPSGLNVLSFRIQVPDDVVSENNERILVIDVSAQPAVVVLLDPPDWEGRFLVSEIGDIARTTVHGYAHVSPGRWIEVGSATPTPEETVRSFARRAALLVTRGARQEVVPARRGQPMWHWPTVVTEPPADAHREWYLSGSLQPSPLADRLAYVRWDSVPPVLGLALQPAVPRGWVAVTARQGRRGAERPAFTGLDSAGTRSLTTVGTGWWRWTLRGGAAREAYRAMLAAGIEWLLGSERLVAEQPLVASRVVSRGQPVTFRWVRDSVPDSLEISMVRDGAEESVAHVARFDANARATVPLEPGTYRWVASDAGRSSGVTVVEEYSNEYRPRVVSSIAGGGGSGDTLLERFARDNWWLFVIVAAALTVEWAWRHQRGLS